MVVGVRVGVAGFRVVGRRWGLTPFMFCLVGCIGRSPYVAAGAHGSCCFPGGSLVAQETKATSPHSA